MLGFMGKMLQHWGCTPKLNCSMVLLLQKTNLSPCSAGACCNVGQWLGALWLSWQMSWLMQSQQADVCISLTVLTSPCRWENEGCFCKGSGIYWSRVHLAPVGAAWCVGVPFCEMSNQRKKEDPLTCLAVFLFIYQNWRSHFFFLFLSTESPCSAEPWLGFSDFCCRTHRAAFLVGYSISSEHIWVTDSVLWLCNTFTWCLVVQRLWLVFNNQLIGSLASQIKPQLTTSRFHRRAHIWVGGVGCCVALCAGLEHVYALVSSDCFVL